MSSPKTHRRFNHDHGGVHVIGRHIPWRRDDESSGPYGSQRLLRSCRPILVRKLNALDGERRQGESNRGSGAVALGHVVEAHVPMQWCGRRIWNRRVGWIPQAAGRQRPFREILNGYQGKIGEHARDPLFGIIDGLRAQDERRPRMEPTLCHLCLCGRYPKMSLTLPKMPRSSSSARADGRIFCSGSVTASCSSSFFCSLLSLFGVIAWTVTSRSPWPRPDTSGMPLPRNLKVVPVCVLSGILTASSPSRPGTLISPPSASVVNANGTVQCRLLPSR